MIFNQPVVIQQIDEREQWVDVLHCHASVNGLFGAEYWQARAVNEEKTVVFTFRYCKALAKLNSADTRIIYRGDTYKVMNIDNLKFENRIVRIKGVAKHGD